MGGRTLVHSPGYDASIADLARKLGDAAIDGNSTICELESLIASNAEAFPLVGVGEVRLLQTEDRDLCDDYVPPLNVFFRILNDQKVELLWLEEDPDRIDGDG